MDHPLTPGTFRCLTDPHLFAQETGVSLKGMSFTKKANGWQVILRGNRRGGQPVYCLYVAVVLEDALQGLFEMITTRGGKRFWYPDKFR